MTDNERNDLNGYRQNKQDQQGRQRPAAREREAARDYDSRRDIDAYRNPDVYRERRASRALEYLQNRENSQNGENPQSRDSNATRSAYAQRRPAASQRASAYRSAARTHPGGTVAEPQGRSIVIPVVIIAVVLLLFGLLIFTRTCQPAQQSRTSAASQQGQAAIASGSAGADAQDASAAAVDPSNDGRVTLLAVGDNTPNDNVGAYADKLSGTEGDGKYDYTPIFQPVASLVQAADLAFENQETTVGGNEIGPQGYPNFNTTDEMADAVVATGFDLIGTANNHSYDWAREGSIEHSLALWKTKPVKTAGTATNADEYNAITTIECEGITFALLNYTYGLNGYEKVAEPNTVHLIDEDAIKADVTRAKRAADVVLVAMHWGDEHDTEPTDEQREQAQMLANLDVDMVIGAHPHVIQPMEWLTNTNGNGHRTLVAYSLGNFLIDHSDPIPDNVLEGMVTCEFVRGTNDGSVLIENVKWTPLVLHVNDDQTEFTVYPAADYTAELAEKNRGLRKVDEPMTWIYEHTKEIVGDKWFS